MNKDQGPLADDAIDYREGRRLPKRLFYGWVLVGASFLSLAVTYTVSYSFSVFYVAILAEFGWSRGSTALASSIFLGVYGFSAPVTGLLLDRFGARRIIPVGGIGVALGLFGCSTIAAPWQLYLYYGVVCGLSLNLIGAVAHMTMLANWFSRLRGTALGLAASGIGMGVFLLVPVVQFIISGWGWRMAYLALGVMVAVVVPTLALMFYRQRPEDLGLAPDGATTPRGQPGRPSPALTVVDTAWAARRWTARSAIATRRFWLLFVAYMLSTLALQTIMTHQVAYLTDRRFAPFQAAAVVGLLGLSSSFAKAFWGWASDRFGREVIYSLGLGCLGLGIVLLGLIVDAAQVWQAYVYAVIFGIGYAVLAPLMPSMAADVFQGPRFASVYGVLYIGTGFGSAIGPWLGGAIFDTTGSYALALVVAACAAVGSIAAAWLAAPRLVRQVPGRAAQPHGGAPT